LERIAKQRRDALDLILTQYGLERFLYRLSQSKYRDHFLLKGALLFSLWYDAPHRPTRDADFLALRSTDLQHLGEVFQSICLTPVEPDGLEFKAETVRLHEIREHQRYQGIRANLLAMLGNARIPLQIDVGFGDAVTPAANAVAFPALLDFPAPHVSTYPKETVVAEKLEAMVQLGLANSRMKDFYDVRMLSLSARERSSSAALRTALCASRSAVSAPSAVCRRACSVATCSCRAFVHEGPGHAETYCNYLWLSSRALRPAANTQPHPPNSSTRRQRACG
jgi:predicted nucleotidyltransferase component of viral defense system